jgi:hypothetical protein
MADPISLVTVGTPGESRAARGGFTTTLDLNGPPILTRQLSASNPLLALRSYRVHGEGQRSVEKSERGCAVRIQYDNAHVDGTFGSKPFEFDWTPAKPSNFDEDKLVELTWGLAMAGRHYLLGPKGEYRPAKAETDANGEAFSILIDAPLRLPQDSVSVGQEWTTEWTGECTHKNTGAQYDYRQTAVVQELTDGATPCARIAFTTSAALRFPDLPGPQREESVLEAKGTVLFNLADGLPVMVESAGSITTDLKQAGVKMIRGVSAKYELV